MRTFLIALLISISACTLPAAEPNAPTAKAGVSGLWLGVMQVGLVHLRMAFEISNTTGGKISGKLLSLDQNGAEVPCKSFAFDVNKLTIEMPAISAKYSGVLAADGNSIAGEFIQLGNPVALNLKRIDKLPTLNRPQHPKKPYPYREEDIRFRNKAASIELAGTLTILKGEGGCVENREC